jgi:hypothetical protein
MRRVFVGGLGLRAALASPLLGGGVSRSVGLAGLGGRLTRGEALRASISGDGNRDLWQGRYEIGGNRASGPDEHGLVELAAPLAAKLVGALGLIGQPAHHPGGYRALPECVAHLTNRVAEVLVVSDDHDIYTHAAPASLAQGGGQGADPVTQPDHFAQAGPRQQHDGLGPGQQVIDGAVGPDATAVGDHISSGQPGEDPAHRTPQQLYSHALLGVAYTGQNVEAAM